MVTSITSMRSLAIVQHFIVLFTLATAGPTTRFTNLQCETLDPNLFTFSQCRLRFIKRGVIGLNIYIRLLRPIADIWINTDFYKKANGYKPFLFNHTTDFCDFQKNQKHIQNLPVKVLFNFISPYSNFNHTCPYNHDIFVKDLLLSEDKFRLIPLPSGDYMLRMTVTIDNRRTLLLKVYYTRTE